MIDLAREKHNLVEIKCGRFRGKRRDCSIASAWLDIVGGAADSFAPLARFRVTDRKLGPWMYVEPAIIDKATAEERIEQAEETPPVPANPVVKRGELWLLDDHRVLCGDATVAEDAARVQSGRAKDLIRLAHLMVTDPPYGVEYDPDWRNRADRANGRPYGDRAVGTVSNDGEADWTLAWKLFGGDVAYCWHADRHASMVQASLEKAGLVVRSQIIWAKDRMISSRGDYHWKHEPCWYAVRKGCKGNWCGDRSQTTLWEIEHRKSETGHGTQKPIECMRRPILNNSKPGDAVYDPFLDSGTTLIAAEMERRKCYGIEIDPAYVQVTIERWQTFTGKIAKREDGATLKDLTAPKRRKSRSRSIDAALP